MLRISRRCEYESDLQGHCALQHFVCVGMFQPWERKHCVPPKLWHVANLLHGTIPEKIIIYVEDECIFRHYLINSFIQSRNRRRFTRYIVRSVEVVNSAIFFLVCVHCDSSSRHYPTFRFMRHSVLSDIPFYPKFRFIRHSVLSDIPFYPTCRFIRQSVLCDKPFYASFRFIWHSVLCDIPSCPTFRFMRHSVLSDIPFYATIRFIRHSVLYVSVLSNIPLYPIFRFIRRAVLSDIPFYAFPFYPTFRFIRHSVLVGGYGYTYTTVHINVYSFIYKFTLC
jgi:hypothetical protein